MQINNRYQNLQNFETKKSVNFKGGAIPLKQISEQGLKMASAATVAMGIASIALGNLAVQNKKSIEPSDVCAEYAKACGKRHIIETVPFELRGINPAISTPSGKIFALPRFCTEEMKVARTLNKDAMRQIKEPTVYTYPKATSEDLERLTSEEIEHSYSRVTWKNPKDGKVYHLLKQGDTEDGKVVVRILDCEGAFVKEVALKPKNIVMIDSDSSIGVLPTQVATHSDLVSYFLYRNNPFVNLYFCNVTGENIVLDNNGNYVDSDVDDDLLVNEIKRVIDSIKNGEQIDYVTVSLATEASAIDKQKLYSDETLKALKELCDVTKGKTRILFSSGNEGEDKINECLLPETIEGVGSLNGSGKISTFSASRNSELTQHYELGEYEITMTPKGFNITGLPGLDIPFHTMSEEELKKARIFIMEEYPKSIEQIKNSVIPDEEKDKLIIYITSKYYDSYNYLLFCENPESYVGKKINGTSFSAPVRTAKLALNDMMLGIL